jgi:CyaY protein
MDEQTFRRQSDAALEDLRRRLLALADQFGYEVEGEGEKLEVLFEEPEETKFVISPNSAARQIWISALATSFKLGWSETAGAFVLEKSGETLNDVMSRILSQQLGTSVRL